MTVGVVIDPELLEPAEAPGVYTFSHARHMLADSIILDNRAAICVVNDKSKLEPRSFVKASGPSAVVKVGSSRLLIIGYGTRVLKGAFKDGKRDLILKNVAVVEGFYTNIVLEQKLRSSGVWYNSYNYTLRYGPLEKSVVLKKLERKYNLVFMELKLISSSYTRAQKGERPVGKLMFPTLKRKVRRPFRRSRDYAKPRSDTAQRWHD